MHNRRHINRKKCGQMEWKQKLRLKQIKAKLPDARKTLTLELPLQVRKHMILRQTTTRVLEHSLALLSPAVGLPCRLTAALEIAGACGSRRPPLRRMPYLFARLRAEEDVLEALRMDVLNVKMLHSVSFRDDFPVIS